jgi:DNA-binding response OmpR family regulator
VRGRQGQPGAHLLLVEDDVTAREALAANLLGHGYVVQQVHTVREAVAAWDATRPDLILLDLGLPDRDGASVIRRVRSESTTPILVLSARTEERDRVEALELGADDYLTKPFSPRELVARIRAVLRRTEPVAPESRVVEVGELLVDLRTRSATFGGSPLALRTLEFELLAELARDAGRVVTRDRLLDRVWGISFPGGTRTVDVHIAQLRKKLGRPEVIQTVRGVGYRLLDGDCA